jgi:hypothetical protein
VNNRRLCDECDPIETDGMVTTQTAGVTAPGCLAKPFAAMQFLHRVKEILTQWPVSA